MDDVGHENERDLFGRFRQVFGLNIDHFFGAADAKNASALKDLLFGQIEMANKTGDLDGEIANEQEGRELKQLANFFLTREGVKEGVDIGHKKSFQAFIKR
jgi:hypothetical protein